MKNWTIRQRIIASFTAILALLLAMVALAYVRLDNVDDLATRIENDSMPGLDLSGRLHALWIENHLLTHQLLLGAGHEALDPHIKLIKANAAEQDKLFTQYEANIFDEADRTLYQNARNARSEYFRLQNALIEACQANPAAQCAAAATDKLDQEYEQVYRTLAALGDINRKDASDSVNKIQAAVATAHASIVSSLLVTFFLVAFSAYYLTSLIGRLQRSSVRVHTSATEIAATAREQQATATEIAATTTEIGATSKEIAATSRELVRTMGEVAQVAENSADLAGTSQSGLSLMEETMQNVIDASSHINAKLAVLNEKAGNIGQVVTTITKVADQTNLLSLNAAIEAEKAGEYGRGFAVVATEIRRLADQAAVATYDIEQMVKEIQSAVSGSVMGMDKFSEEVRRGMQEMQRIGAQLSQLISQVQALAPRFESVSEGMQAQATGAEQITQALTQLSEASQQTVESLSQSSQAIEELNRVASGLRSGTGQRARAEA